MTTQRHVTHVHRASLAIAAVGACLLLAPTAAGAQTQAAQCLVKMDYQKTYPKAFQAQWTSNTECRAALKALRATFGKKLEAQTPPADWVEWYAQAFDLSYKLLTDLNPDPSTDPEPWRWVVTMSTDGLTTSHGCYYAALLIAWLDGKSTQQMNTASTMAATHPDNLSVLSNLMNGPSGTEAALIDVFCNRPAPPANCCSSNAVTAAVCQLGAGPREWLSRQLEQIRHIAGQDDRGAIASSDVAKSPS